MLHREKRFSEKEEGLWLWEMPLSNSTLFRAPYISFHDTLNGYIEYVSNVPFPWEGCLLVPLKYT